MRAVGCRVGLVFEKEMKKRRVASSNMSQFVFHLRDME